MKGRDPNAPQFCDACFTGDYPVVPVDFIASADKETK